MIGWFWFLSADDSAGKAVPLIAVLSFAAVVGIAWYLARVRADRRWRAALDRYRDKVIIGENFDLSNPELAIEVPPNTSLIPAPQIDDDRVGYVAFFPDQFDPKIRSARYTITEGGNCLRDPSK